jgi:uncharacterized protein
MTKKIYIRFYDDLNDFLPEPKKQQRFIFTIIDRTSVKDAIESIGIPHIEIDVIIVNGISVDFNYLINDNDNISVFPQFTALQNENLIHLKKPFPSKIKFTADNHLGALARYLRMIGIDTLYENDIDVHDYLNEERIILTKNLRLLKEKKISYGYYVRNILPAEQLKEVVNKFRLQKIILEFSRCLECNNPLTSIDKDLIKHRIPPKVYQWQNEFHYCDNCDKIYWKGSHYERMSLLIKSLK